MRPTGQLSSPSFPIGQGRTRRVVLGDRAISCSGSLFAPGALSGSGWAYAGPPLSLRHVTCTNTGPHLADHVVEGGDVSSVSVPLGDMASLRAFQVLT